MEELKTGGVESLRQTIFEHAAAVRKRAESLQSDEHYSEPSISTPTHQSHSRPSSPGPETSGQSSGTDATTTTDESPGELDTVSIPPKYLLVCVSQRQYETEAKVREITIAHNWGGVEFSTCLHAEYKRSRQDPRWSIPLFLRSFAGVILPSKYLPTDWIGYLTSTDSILRKWWHDWVPDCGLWAPLYLPCTANYVKVNTAQNYNVVSKMAC